MTNYEELFCYLVSKMFFKKQTLGINKVLFLKFVGTNLVDMYIKSRYL